MSELLQVLTPLGIGGILAAFIFWVYQRDQKTHEIEQKANADKWKGQSELFAKVVTENTAAITSNTEVTRENSELTKAFHRRLDSADFPHSSARSTMRRRKERRK